MKMLMKRILHLLLGRKPNTGCNEIFILIIDFVVCLTYRISDSFIVLLPFNCLKVHCNRNMDTFREQEIYASYLRFSQRISVWVALFRISCKKRHTLTQSCSTDADYNSRAEN